MAQPRRLNLDEQAKIGSLTTAILADLAVTTEKLADGSVTVDKLDSGVISGAVPDGSITPAKLSFDPYGAGLVANGTTQAIDVNVDGTTLEIASDIVRIKNGGVIVAKININTDLPFNNHQALSLRIENLSSFPSPGNIGRLVWRTDLNTLYVDTGIGFTAVGSGSGHTIQDEGIALTQRSILNFVGAGVTVTDDGSSKTIVTIPQGGHSVEDEGTPLTQRAVLNFVGPNVLVTDTGSKTQVSITAPSSTYAKDLFTVVSPIPDHILLLSSAPLANSEIVGWNGLILRPGAGNDYTISGSTIVLNAGITLTIGDQIVVVYAS